MGNTAITLTQEQLEQLVSESVKHAVASVATNVETDVSTTAIGKARELVTDFAKDNCNDGLIELYKDCVVERIRDCIGFIFGLIGNFLFHSSIFLVFLWVTLISLVLVASFWYRYKKSKKGHTHE